MSSRTESRPTIVVPAVADDVVARIVRASGLSPVTCRVLAARGLVEPADVRAFLEPSLVRDWSPPSVIPGMDDAAEVVAEHVRAGNRILVFGDFDLDGISAAAVAVCGLQRLGADVAAIVPHRFREGYGLTEASLDRALAMKPSLVVTVDCGVSSSREVEMLRAAGVAVVVTDHHEPGDSVPRDVPVANPKLDPTCPSHGLAGAGVALKLIQAVGARMGDMESWKDQAALAMLGTIGDVVPLVGENRALVAYGLSSVRQNPPVGIAALCAVANVDVTSLASDRVAYALAPRLNAAGRMDDPAVALDLLLERDPARAEQLARALDGFNILRQETEADLTAAAMAQAERVLGPDDRVLVLSGDGWHEGVKGIVASRLAHAFGVPTFLFTIIDGEARGSGRSVPSVDLYQAVSAADDLLIRFGGHAAAVGLTMAEERLDEFAARMSGVLSAYDESVFVSRVEVDAEIQLEDASVELVSELDMLSPYGHGNPQPCFVTRRAFMTGRERVGKEANHLRFTAYDGVVSVPAIAFRLRGIDEEVGNDMPVDLVFEVTADEWRGRTRLQLSVREVVPRAVSSEAPAFDLIEDLFAHADEILAREEYAGIEDADSFHTKLAGVTFEGRQTVLGRLSPGDPLRIEREPDNAHDSCACAVFDAAGDQVGFLNRRLSAALAPLIDAGVGYDIEVTDVTGGDDGRSLGLNVLVTRRGSADDAQEDARVRVERRSAFSAMRADERYAELVRAFIGEGTLHPAQVDSLAHLGRGESTLTVMATGRGKSLIFHLHAARIALEQGVASVFVFPLRALVADQAHHLAESFATVGLSVTTVTGESSQAMRDEAFEALRTGSLDVVLTTPEFLDVHAARFARAARIGFLVVDEAHHVGLARAGHRPAYARLGDAVRTLGNPTVLAVTATCGDDAAEVIQAGLGISAVVLDPSVRDNLALEDQRERADKDAYVAALAARGDKVIIYVNSREQSVRIARTIRKRVPEVAARTAFYNGGLARSARHAVEHAFREGSVRVVVATSAFGEGVNIPDIRHVVLYHMPFSSVEFNQMCGRAGRDGALARIHPLFGSKDARLNEMILSSLAPSRDDMASIWRVLKAVADAEGGSIEITNADIATRAKAVAKGFSLDERGVSSAIGVLRDLGLVVSEGSGAYRRIILTPPTGGMKLELESSVRYAEGLDEIGGFRDFREWVLTSDAQSLLARFNRPILPTRDGEGGSPA